MTRSVQQIERSEPLLDRVIRVELVLDDLLAGPPVQVEHGHVESCGLSQGHDVDVVRLDVHALDLGLAKLLDGLVALHEVLVEVGLRLELHRGDQPEEYHDVITDPLIVEGHGQVRPVFGLQFVDLLDECVVEVIDCEHGEAQLLHPFPAGRQDRGLEGLHPVFVGLEPVEKAEGRGPEEAVAVGPDFAHGSVGFGETSDVFHEIIVGKFLFEILQNYQIRRNEGRILGDFTGDLLLLSHDQTVAILLHFWPLINYPIIIN